MNAHLLVFHPEHTDTTPIRILGPNDSIRIIAAGLKKLGIPCVLVLLDGTTTFYGTLPRDAFIAVLDHIYDDLAPYTIN